MLMYFAVYCRLSFGLGAGLRETDKHFTVFPCNIKFDHKLGLKIGFHKDSNLNWKCN